MKYYVILVLTLLLSVRLGAQKPEQDKIDSLISVLSKAKNDTVKAGLLSQLSFLYNRISPAEGIKYGMESLTLSDDLHWQKGVANASNSIAGNYFYMSDYYKAVDYFFKSLNINESLHDSVNIAENLSNIGNVYALQGNNVKALEYFEKTLQIFRHMKNKEGIAVELGNEGNIYYTLGDFDNALKSEVNALSISREINKESEVAKNLGNIGNVYAAKQNFEEALTYEDSALNIYKKLGDKNGIAINTGNIGETYLQIGKATGKAEAYRKAINYLKQAIAIDQEIGDLINLKEFSQYLSESYEQLGNYKEALENFKAYTLFSDSVFSIEKRIKIVNLENQRALDLKDKQIVINKLAVTKKRNESIFLGVVVILLFFLLILVIYERKKTETLMLNILPGKIAGRLKKKEHPIADYFANVSILFIDMAGFTNFSRMRAPKDTVNMLNDIFTRFDALAEKYGLEKIKTIGDCYMAVSGLPDPRPDHAAAAVKMAIEIKQTIKGYQAKDGTVVEFRFGLDCGPVVAGVIGRKKFIYDVWGDAVNTASRMETTGIANEIHCTDTFKRALEGAYEFTSRGFLEVKGKGAMQTWILNI